MAGVVRHLHYFGTIVRLSKSSGRILRNSFSFKNTKTAGFRGLILVLYQISYKVKKKSRQFCKKAVIFFEIFEAFRYKTEGKKKLKTGKGFG